MPDTQEIKLLIERLESASGPDRVLDGDLVLALGGPPDDAMPFQSEVAWTYRGGGEWFTPSPRSIGLDIVWRCPAYTGSLDSALSLVERKLPGRDIVLEIKELMTDGVVRRITDATIGAPYYSDEKATSGYGSNPPLALLIALLKALQP